MKATRDFPGVDPLDSTDAHAALITRLKNLEYRFEHRMDRGKTAAHDHRLSIIRSGTTASENEYKNLSAGTEFYAGFLSTTIKLNEIIKVVNQSEYDGYTLMAIDGLVIELQHIDEQLKLAERNRFLDASHLESFRPLMIAMNTVVNRLGVVVMDITP